MQNYFGYVLTQAAQLALHQPSDFLKTQVIIRYF